MKLITISDLHASIKEYGEKLGYLRLKYPNDYISIQLGDFGFGFTDVPEDFGEENFFFVGNHDNRELANKHNNCLGDYGVKEINGKKIFWLSGAESPLFDRNCRTTGVDWWPSEQLPIPDLMKAIDLYRETKPDIVLSHDCPDTVRRQMFRVTEKSNTSFALQAMFEIYKPSIWVFGHWHCNRQKNIDGTLFVCKEPLDTYEIDI